MGRARVDTRLIVALLLVAACVTVYGLARLVTELQPYREAGQEYEALRGEYAPKPAGGGVAVTPAAVLYSPAPALAVPDLAAINPDYTGWLQIADTGIDYPVVRGEDNSKYLSTTFEGKENKAGAIFLDYRCTEGFDARHAILYGHNMNDGSMFGGLARYLEDGYLEQHPEITVTLPDGQQLTYRIFAAWETDTADKAYKLDFADEAAFAAFAAALGAPEGTERILTLSTCADAGGRDGRVVVHGALVD